MMLKNNQHLQVIDMDVHYSYRGQEIAQRLIEVASEATGLSEQEYAQGYFKYL